MMTLTLTSCIIVMWEDSIDGLTPVKAQTSGAKGSQREGRGQLDP